MFLYRTEVLSIKNFNDSFKLNLLPPIGTMSALENLNFSSSFLNDNHVIPLANSLSKNSIPLKSLNIERNAIKVEGIRMLAKALESNTTLIGLRLNYNQAHDEGAVALAHSLIVNTSLCYLFLSNNGIHDTGLQAFADSLGKNNTLIRLELYNNYFSAYKATAVTNNDPRLLWGENILYLN